MANLLNRAEVRRQVLARCSADRPTVGFSRVSAGYLDWLEGRISAMIQADVHCHPSNGKTFGGSLVPRE
ncbi:MAG TPA: hypothetical protein VMY35_10605 [Phycisphaerae bacterium]|nr:hypothetical protein [Phycisphaerae bacterium]